MTKARRKIWNEALEHAALIVKKYERNARSTGGSGFYIPRSAMEAARTAILAAKEADA